MLGFEQFGLGHDLGASAGRSRIIRKAYFEGPGYIPLLRGAYELWYELERETGATVLDLERETRKRIISAFEADDDDIADFMVTYAIIE